MSEDVTVASTTDSEEDVRLAVGIQTEGDEPEEGAESEEGEKPSKAAAESETAKPEDDKSKSAAASEAAKAGDEEPKGKGGFQKRIDRLTEEKYNLRDENRELRERLERLETLLPKDQPKTEVQEDVKPTRDKFKSDEEYHENLGRWAARQEVKTAEANAATRATNDELAVVFGNYNEGVADFKVENPDFDEVVGDSDLKIPMAVQNAIISYEQEGPALAYYLAKNPEVVARMAKMNDVRSVAEIGRIHASLYPEVVEEAPKKVEPAPAPKKPVSKAPAPIKPARAAGSATAVPIDELPYADYRRVRDQQERGRIRR